MGGDRDEHLDELRWHWGSAYLISHPEADVWVAQRRDTCETLVADGPWALREKIRADYLAHPIPRRNCGPRRHLTTRQASTWSRSAPSG